MKGSRRRPALLALCGSLLLVVPARAEQMPLGAEAQIPLLLKVLTYDRNFEQKAGAELALGIVHDPSDRDSAKATEEVGSTLYKFAGKTGQGLYQDVVAEIDWSVGQILDALEQYRLTEHTLVIFSSRAQMLAVYEQVLAAPRYRP